MSNTNTDEFFAEGGSGSNFQPHPEGPFQAVVCDIRSLGMLPVKFKGEDKGEKPHILVSFQTDEKIQSDDPENKLNGKPYLVSRRYTLSMAENARLRKDVEAIMGRKLTAVEAKPRGFNVAEILGRNCQVTIQHSEPRDGRVYANIVSIAPWNPKYGANLTVDPDFVRFKDRPENAGAADDAQLKDSIAKLKAQVNVAATYGIEPISPIDFANLSFGQAEDMNREWAEAIEQARAKRDTDRAKAKESASADSDGEDDDFDFDDEYDKSVEEEKAAPAKKLGNISDAVKVKASKAKEESAAQAPDPAFEQSPVDLENARLALAGREPVSEAMTLVIQKADDQMLDVANFMDNSDALAAINARLAEMKKKPVVSLDELNKKTAGCALVMKEIAEGRIEW